MADDTPDALRDIELKIGAGHLDGDLVKILQAVNRRLQAGPTQSKWLIRWGDDEYTEESLTMGEVRRAEELAGMSWVSIHPMTSAKSAAALLQAFLEYRGGLSKSLAAKTVESMTADSMVDAIDQYEVEAPKAGSDSETEGPS